MKTASILIYASNEPKSVLAQDLGDCRDNLRNSRSVFLIVFSYEDSAFTGLRKGRKCHNSNSEDHKDHTGNAVQCFRCRLIGKYCR